MDNKYYPNLFKKGKIGNLTLKNRAIRNSMGTYLRDFDGSVSFNSLNAAAEAADGGAGLVFMDNAAVTESKHMGLCIESDDRISSLSQLADVIHLHGALAGIQFAHAGRDGGFVGGDDIVAASRITFEPWFEMGAQVPREMTIEEIRDMTERFGDAGRRARQAGFDICEIMAAAGTLPTNFLSPADNQRRDMYGGSLKNRMRFLLECVRSIQKKAGPDYPISVKLSVCDFEENSITAEETIEVAKALEQQGVALLNLVCGTHAVAERQSSFYPQGYFAEYAEKVKKEVNIPVIATSILTPEFAENLLAEGKCDFIGLGRTQLADPFWVRKAKEGRAEDIKPCIRCMIGCHDRGMLIGNVIHCTVNPTLYKYECPAIVPTENRKSIAVIGGGPGGLEAAVTAAKRGHKVTLYEKKELGGLMIEASVPEYKQDIKRLIEYYKVQLKKLNITVKMEEASAQTIREGGFDAAIVAIGGAPRTPDVPGIEQENVFQCLDYLDGRAKPDGKTALVIGGGITGAETAVELSKAGKDVTIVEMMDDFLAQFGVTIPAYHRIVAEANVKVLTGKRSECIEGKKAILVDRFGNHTELEADAIVLAAGFQPQRKLAEELEEFLEDVVEVGDCIAARQIYDAIREGYIAARCL